ncbi:MAG: regulatory protein RecX, partial [Bacteroidales bacterium]|nr:regulatory protein RecX [Bacteroidales bacterium]
NIIDRLKNERYIDEHRYCKAFTNDKMRYNHWGEHKIAAALRAKGIPDTTIAAALNAIGNDEWKDALMPEMKKKARLLKADNHERHNRLIRFAMQRGFSYTIAEQCVASIEED